MSESIMTDLTRLGEKTKDSASTPKVMPIYLTSVFSFDDVETLEKIYSKELDGYIYTRMNNPIYDALNEIMSKIDKGTAAQVFSSGMAAVSMAILSNVESGDHIIASSAIYGGTLDFLKNELKRYCVDVTFVDIGKENIEEYLNKRTKIVFMETISNPLMQVDDIRKTAQICKRNNLKLIVDNTFATPVICNPLELGADIVVYSVTKYMGGHSDITGGAVISDQDTMQQIKRSCSLYGTIMSPFDGWLLMRSLRTLELRVKLHSQNAMRLASFLETHNKIRKVYYPGLQSFATHVVAEEIFKANLFGGMLSIDIANGEKGACDLIKAMTDIKLVPSLAGVSTSISYPARTSHRYLEDCEREKNGITKGLLRISTGLENIDDIIDDFDKALMKI